MADAYAVGVADTHAENDRPQTHILFSIEDGV